jgi:PDZ domain
MVLIIRRAARIALVSLLPVAAARAQRGPTEIRIGDRPVLFGFALGCIDCAPGEGARGRVGGGGRASTPAVWSYRNYPRVEAVIPGGTADSAGIREGDVLKAIDGLSLLSDEGTRRMSTVAVGETVRLSFERNSTTFNVPLKLGPTPNRRGAAQREMILVGHTALRSAAAGGAGFELDVWSDDAVHLTLDSAARTFTFKIGDAILRLRVPETFLRDTTANGAGARGRGKPEP